MTFTALRLLGRVVLTLLGMLLLLFVLLRALPGSYADVLYGDLATDADRARIEEEHGLDRPVFVQFGAYVGQVARGDLGTSVAQARPVSEVVGEALPVTLKLSAVALTMTVISAVALAVIAAWRQGSRLDGVIRAIPLFAAGLPAFWTGVMLLWLLAQKLRVLPPGGPGTGFWGQLESLLLPAITLTIAYTAILLRSLRASIVTVLRSDHVAVARAKGLRGRRLLLGHVLPNAAVPALAIVGLSAASLLSGSLVIENVFGLPGIGTALVTAFRNQDFPVVQAIVLVAGLMVVLVTVAVDALQALIDPRLRGAR